MVKIRPYGDLDRDFDVPLAFSTGGIVDGGGDMYDDANLIDTDLTQSISDVAADKNLVMRSIPNTHRQALKYGNRSDAPYSIASSSYYDYQPIPSGLIKDGDRYFGSGSQYFTCMFPGMFVLVATDISITGFYVSGNIGSDGHAADTTTMFPISTGGETYTAFLKTNTDTNDQDPSINHIIIVPGGPSGIIHSADYSGEYDDDFLESISSNEIYYLCVSRYPTAALSLNDAKAVATRFIEVINGI